MQQLASFPAGSKRQRWLAHYALAGLRSARGTQQFRVRWARKRRDSESTGCGGEGLTPPSLVPSASPPGKLPVTIPATCFCNPRKDGCVWMHATAPSRSQPRCGKCRRKGPDPQPAHPVNRRARSRPQDPPLTSLIRAPPPGAALHTWRSPRPCALIGGEPAAWGAGPGWPGRGRKVAAARRWGRGALTRMFTPGHPGKWKRRALLLGGEPQTPGPGPPPTPPPW